VFFGHFAADSVGLTFTQRNPGKTVYDKVMCQCHGRSIAVIEIGVKKAPQLCYT